MTNIADDKRLNDEQLEAVAGGVTPPTIDPSMLAAQLMQSQLNAALGVATGGAHPVDTHAAVDTGTPTITGQTHATVAASDIFGGGSSTASNSSHPEDLTLTITGTATLSTSLPPGTVPEQGPTVQPMHFDNSSTVWTTVTPAVGAQNLNAPTPGGTSHSGDTDSIHDQESIAFKISS